MTITSEQLKQGIQRAQANPNSPFAVELRKRIDAGNFDAQFQELGISPPSRPKPEQERTIRTGLEGVGESTLGLASDVKDIVKERGSNLGGVINDYQQGKTGVLRSGLRAAGQLAGSLTDTLGATIGRAAQAFVPEAIKQDVVREAGNFAQSDNGRAVIGALSQGIDTFKEWERKNPETAKDFRSLVNIVDFATIAGLSGPAKKTLQEAVDTGVATARIAGKEVLETGVERLRSGVGVLEKIQTARQDSRIAKIQDLVSPKINAKETRAILEESRVTKGKSGRLFGKRPDVVEQASGVQKASETIDRLIPDAYKLDEFAINDRLKGEVRTIATELRPQLQQVPLEQGLLEQGIGAWEQLRKAQALNPEFEAFGGAKRFQSNFQGFLDDAVSANNLDELWDVRKAYDNSISSTIKQATSNSAPSTQLQKDMWLENRTILNDMINDSARGLGDISQQAFSDMTDMYTARQNIISRAKIDVKGKAGILSRKNLEKAGLLWIGGNIFEKTTGINIPFI